MTRTHLQQTVAGVTFAVGLALWTWKLLDPNPVPAPVREALSFWEWLPFAAAKCLHMGGYAFLAVTGQLAVARRFRPAVAAFLIAHGAATEVGQTYVPNRSGNVRDVLIDATGVVAGTLLLRRVTRDCPAPEPR